MGYARQPTVHLLRYFGLYLPVQSVGTPTMWCLGTKIEVLGSKAGDPMDS